MILIAYVLVTQSSPVNSNTGIHFLVHCGVLTLLNNESLNLCLDVGNFHTYICLHTTSVNKQKLKAAPQFFSHQGVRCYRLCFFVSAMPIPSPSLAFPHQPSKVIRYQINSRINWGKFASTTRESNRHIVGMPPASDTGILTSWLYRCAITLLIMNILPTDIILKN